MVVTSSACFVHWCLIVQPSNIWRTVEDFNEEFNNLKAAMKGSDMKRSVVVHVSTQWVTVLLHSEVLHYLQMSFIGRLMQWCYSLIVQMRWITVHCSIKYLTVCGCPRWAAL